MIKIALREAVLRNLLAVPENHFDPETSKYERKLENLFYKYMMNQGTYHCIGEQQQPQ